MRRIVLVTLLMIIPFIGVCKESAQGEGKTKRNVPYSDVLKAPFNEPTATLSYGADALQFGYLWLPDSQAPDGGFPLVIFIHGGCWLNAYDINHSRALTSALAEQGYAVWSLEYRRTGDAGGGWPGTFMDIVRGINHVATMTTYSIDSSRTYLVGHSAGGHLALLAASRELSVPITKVIGLAAISDLHGYARGSNSCQKVTPSFMGGMPEERAEEYERASPLGKGLSSPVLLLHGSSDAIVPSEFSKLKSAQWQSLEGGGHFDWIHPQSDGFEMLLQALE